MQVSTFMKVVAGSVPHHGQGSMTATIQLMAQEALGVDQVHYVCTPRPDNGRYHYFALPSRMLASEPKPVFPLALALPGHPLHKGPGAYVYDVGTHKIAALFDGESMDFLINEAPLVDEALDERGLPIYHADDESLPWRFETTGTRTNRIAQQLSSKLLKFSFFTMAIAAPIYVGSLAANGWLNAKITRDTTAAEESLATAMRDIALSSTLTKRVDDYEKRLNVIVRAGGWVDAYQVTKGAKDKDAKESFRMFVPNWITEDYMKELGSGVTADKDPGNEQLLILVKGTPEGKNIDSRNTVAKEDPKAAEAAQAAEAAASAPPEPPKPSY